MGLLRALRERRSAAPDVPETARPAPPAGPPDPAVVRLADLGREAADAQRLMASGRVGRAVVTARRDTGVVVNENPEVELELQVSVEGGPRYPVLHRQIISRLVTANFTPGATVPVRVDPIDPRRLLIA
jgi:hypothetical protein